jgi:uncharacterized SAM-binding protein YcdF (DUF218 family)/lysophospholipase L1-like esterase
MSDTFKPDRPASGVSRSRWRFGFGTGVICGVLLVLGTVVVINKSNFPDLLISPLVSRDTTGTADAIVVMGASVIGDCVPNQNAVRRVLRGAHLWRERRAPILVFTGGSDGTSCPVAEAMAKLATDIGIPPSSIHVEKTSRTTRENGEHTVPLLRGLGVRRVLVVTDKLHMPRSAGTFAALGFEVERASVPIYEGHPDNLSMLTAGAREMAALTYYRMKGWVADSVSPAVAGASPGRSVMQTGKAEAAETVIVLGASYAGGWKVKNIAGLHIIVKGVSGQQSFEMLERFERDVIAARPRAVIIWGFINDLFRAQPQQSAAAAARVRDSFARMIELAQHNGIEPIVATEVTIGAKAGLSETLASWVGWARGKESYQDRINAQVRAVNESIVRLARDEGLLVLDFQSVLAEGGGGRRREFADPDGSHITPAGYDALTEYARPILAKHFAAVKPAHSRP